MNNMTSLLLLDNKPAILILMIVLIALVILLTVLGIVFIVALRKRRPVVKVVMAPAYEREPAPAPVAAQPVAIAQPPVEEEEPEEETPVPEESVQEPEPEPQPVIETDSVDEDDEGADYVIEGHERVRYNRSFAAKLCQLGNDAKEWYSSLKNELLSYDKVKGRTSWKRESFRIGRMTVARLVVRGKTLCLLLAVEPAGYDGTKYKVEDVSNVANTVDTPTLYRIKSVRRLKYAKEIIEGLMKELKSYKRPDYHAQDFFIPYEGDVSLMQKGLVKRVVTGSTRVYKIEEVDLNEQDEADTANDETGAGSGENL